jgi:FKBP-type peptidyl-prolyl cis-trans isomerase FkpA
MEGLKIDVEVAGSGAAAKAGDNISVHYSGSLTNGKKFDSSIDRDEPFNFTLGQGQVIQGWDKGFDGMTVGTKAKLTIHPDLAYGPMGIGGVIPGDATLIFDVELLAIL